MASTEEEGERRRDARVGEVFFFFVVVDCTTANGALCIVDARRDGNACTYVRIIARADGLGNPLDSFDHTVVNETYGVFDIQGSAGLNKYQSWGGD